MYKRALTVLLTAHLLFLAGFLCLGQMEEIQRNLQIKVPVAADSESRMIGIASRTSSGQRVVGHGGAGGSVENCGSGSRM